MKTKYTRLEMRLFVLGCGWLSATPLSQGTGGGAVCVWQVEDGGGTVCWHCGPCLRNMLILTSLCERDGELSGGICDVQKNQELWGRVGIEHGHPGPAS